MSDSLSSVYGGRGIAIVSGKGGLVYDNEGREYVDFFNGHGASLFGHGDAALLESLERASKGVWSTGAGFESPERSELAELLGGILGGGRAFICNSGSEAIEAALKLAVSLKQGRHKILACRRAFHGRTSGALSLTFNPKYKTPFKRVLADVEHYNPEELPSKIDADAIAVFVEPVQGEGGVYPLPPETGRAISETCGTMGALLVADEIQSGLGRCGAMLASELTGLEPDIVCLAKGLAGGLPIGAAVWKKELGDFPPHCHGSTYGGNEIACAVAVTALRLITERDCAAHAAWLGEKFRAALSEIQSAAIKEVRGLGMLNGAEVEISATELVKKLQNKGLLSLSAGPRVVRFLQSFASTEDHIRRAADIFRGVLEGEGK
jgi:acetylornithine/LysW-gamma-L-lysine aminotransferase